MRCVERGESMGSRYFSPGDLQFFSRHPSPNILTDARAIDQDPAFTQAPASPHRGGASRVSVPVPELETTGWSAQRPGLREITEGQGEPALDRDGPPRSPQVWPRSRQPHRAWARVARLTDGMALRP